MDPEQRPLSGDACRALSRGRDKARARMARKPIFALFLLFLACHLTGCIGERAHVERNLMADQHNPKRSEGVADHYRVQCPDVLDLRVAFRPELSQRYPVSADGCIDLGEYGRLRVEGKTPPVIARLVAEEVGQSPPDVRVQVVEFRSQHLLVFGQVVGWQQAIPYQGQETVLDLLQRVGGITPGAEPRDVYVVRTRLHEGERPELFKIDLDAIVLKKDMSTNLRLLPFDQIYVGETRKSRVERNIPPLLRPIIQIFSDVPHSEKKPS